MILPIYNRYDETWLIDNEDGTFSTISNEEYRQWFEENVEVKFKTRYDV